MACVPVENYPNYKRFNPDKYLTIDSVCTEQCKNAEYIGYEFSIYMNTGTLVYPNWVLYVDKERLLEGKLSL